VKLVQSVGFNPHPRAGAAIAVMFGQMYNAAILGNTHIDGRAWLKAVFPVNLKAQEINVKFPRFGFVKDA
jgi:hypothetical protein